MAVKFFRLSEIPALMLGSLLGSPRNRAVLIFVEPVVTKRTKTIIQWYMVIEHSRIRFICLSPHLIAKIKIPCTVVLRYKKSRLYSTVRSGDQEFLPEVSVTFGWKIFQIKHISSGLRWSTHLQNGLNSYLWGHIAPKFTKDTTIHDPVTYRICLDF